MLFENSIVCLVVFVCCFAMFLFSRLGNVVLFFDASLFGVFLLGRIFLIRMLPGLWSGGFCLESLILAQDERWRRA